MPPDYHLLWTHVLDADLAPPRQSCGRIPVVATTAREDYSDHMKYFTEREKSAWNRRNAVPVIAPIWE